MKGLNPLRLGNSGFLKWNKSKDKIRLSKMPHFVTKNIYKEGLTLKLGVTGFSLVEIVVAIGIFLILIFAIFTMVESGRSVWFTGSVSVGLRQEVIKAFIVMEEELKETRPSQISLSSGSSSSTLTFKIPQDNDNDGTILDSSGNVEWSNNITYSLNGANQITRTDSSVTTIFANGVTSLLFTRPTTPLSILQVDISGQKSSPAGRVIQDSGQIIIKMRN